jgi:hypothetical protein
MTDSLDNTPQYRAPHLDIDGQSIEWLEDFEMLVSRGVIPAETGYDYTANNVWRANHGFQALKFYIELTNGWNNPAATQIADCSPTCTT